MLSGKNFNMIYGQGSPSPYDVGGEDVGGQLIGAGDKAPEFLGAVEHALDGVCGPCPKPWTNRYSTVAWFLLWPDNTPQK